MKPQDAPRSPPKLAARWRISLYLVAAMIWLTGTIWVSIEYFSDEGYAARQWLLRIHVLFGLIGVWLFGVLWAMHVVPAWRKRQKRWSGSAMFVLTVWLAATGYYIYHAPPEWSDWVEFLHWTFGLGAPAMFLLHRFLTARNGSNVSKRSA